MSPLPPSSDLETTDDRTLSAGELLQLAPGLSRADLEAIKAKRRERKSPSTLVAAPWWWAAMQRAIAFTATVCLSPVFAFLYVVQKATMPGPFFFRQQRRGMGGVPFEILKVRTMTVGSEEKTALGVQVNDPAVTRLGKVMRTFKLDELPQLWNIVRGDMELVGPRPIPMPLEDEITAHLPEFAQRHRVKPGLTNVGQVSVMDNQLGGELLKDWEIRAEAERHYVANKSFSYDVVLVVLTSLFIVRKFYRQLLKKGGDGAHSPTEGIPATEVLGIPIANLDYQGVIEQSAEWIEAGEPHRYICIAPVHSVVEGGHAGHRKSLIGADIVTADGMPVVWAQKLLGHKNASRVYGPTLMLKTLRVAEREGWRMAFYGGHTERLPVLLDKLKEKFPTLEVVYAESPPFRALTEEEDREIVRKLNEAKPDIIWVGLGCPKQERWMHEHVERVPGVMFGVGAAFDFHAGVVRQAPAFLQKIGMEWFFRLLCEPRRLFKRYATTNPIYVFKLGLQVFSRYVLRRKYQVRH